MNYNLLQEIFQKYFVVHEQLAVKSSFSTYVCYAPDGLFWLNLYTLGYLRIVIIEILDFIIALAPEWEVLWIYSFW